MVGINYRINFLQLSQNRVSLEKQNTLFRDFWQSWKVTSSQNGLKSNLFRPRPREQKLLFLILTYPIIHLKNRKMKTGIWVSQLKPIDAPKNGKH